jgi:N-acetylmuramoyl-L-alanine amidase
VTRRRVTIAEPPIITTDEWGARRPRGPLHHVGRPVETIFHHTAGHHPEISLPRDESRAEAIAYARAIQHAHMSPSSSDPSKPWNDSGHNFLICRNGLILVGRHQSLPLIREGRMVLSAHCPGRNGQPGIEHEHLGGEAMTPAQLRSSVWLHAWIIDRCRMFGGRVIAPHSRYFATACPGALAAQLPLVRRRVDELLSGTRQL